MVSLLGCAMNHRQHHLLIMYVSSYIYLVIKTPKLAYTQSITHTYDILLYHVMAYNQLEVFNVFFVKNTSRLSYCKLLFQNPFC